MSDATRDEKVWATIEKLYEERGFRLFLPATIEMHTDGISETDAFLSLKALATAGKLRHEVEIGCEEGHVLWCGPVATMPPDDTFTECLTCAASFDDETELVHHPRFILDRPAAPTKEDRLEADVERLVAALRDERDRLNAERQHWFDEARRYSQNVDYWRERARAALDAVRSYRVPERTLNRQWQSPTQPDDYALGFAAGVRSLTQHIDRAIAAGVVP